MSRRRIAASLSDPIDTEKSEAMVVTSLARGLSILSLFNPSRPELTIRQIAQMIELPYPTVWRLCHTMEHCGFLTTLPGSGRVSPSGRALMLGHTVVSRYPVADVIYPQMQAMTEKYKIGLSLGTRIGLEMVYLRRTYGSFVAFNRTSLPIMGAPTGWALLAASERADREALMGRLHVAYPEHWEAFKGAFEAALPDYERTGYVVIREITKVFPEMRNVEATCIAVPIRSGAGNEILGLSCAGSPKILTDELCDEVGNALLDISRTMRPVHA